jgi:hypothetical protein
MDEQSKPSIDERLEALTQNVEILTHDVHELQDSMREMQRRMDAADLRERKARRALLVGIQAYLNALDDNGDGA